MIVSEPMEVQTPDRKPSAKKRLPKAAATKRKTADETTTLLLDLSDAPLSTSATPLTRLLDCVPSRMAVSEVSPPQPFELVMQQEEGNSSFIQSQECLMPSYLWDAQWLLQQPATTPSGYFRVRDSIQRKYTFTTHFDRVSTPEDRVDAAIADRAVYYAMTTHVLYRLQHLRSPSVHRNYVFLDMDTKYRCAIVCRPDLHKALQRIFEDDLLPMLAKDPSSSCLLIGYRLSSSPTLHERFLLLPGGPFTAAHCDVCVPRQGKLDSLLTMRDRKCAKTEELVSSYSNVPVPVTAPLVVLPIVMTADDSAVVAEDADEAREVAQRNADHVGDNVSGIPLLGFVPQNVMMAPMAKKRRSSTAVGSPPAIADPSSLPLAAATLPTQGLTPGNGSSVRVVERVLKRRDYSMVADGTTSAVLMLKSFYKASCRILCAAAVVYDVDRRNAVTRYQKFTGQSEFDDDDDDEDDADDHDIKTSPTFTSTKSVCTAPPVFTVSVESDIHVAHFILQGGIKEAYVTLPRMHRLGLMGIANVILNYYIELPAQAFVFDFRLIEHCPIQLLIEEWLPRQIEERLVSMHYLANLETYTALFPLVGLNPTVRKLPSFRIVSILSNNLVRDITDQLLPLFDSVLPRLLNRPSIQNVQPMY